MQLSEEPSLYTLQEWHVAPLLPVLFAAAIQSWGRLRGRWRTAAAGLMVVGSLWAFSQYSLAPAAWLAPGTPPERARQIEAILARVSPASTVSAQTDIVPHVSQRRAVYVFPSVIEGADDIVLDRQGNTYPVSDRYAGIVDGEVLPRPDFRLRYDRDGLLWLQKEAPPAEATSPLAVFGDQLTLKAVRLALADSAGFFDQWVTGEKLVLKRGSRLQVNLYWQRTGAADENLKVFVQLLDDGSGKVIGQHDGPPVGGARPIRSWKLTEIVRDTHYVEPGDEQMAGPGRVIVGLYYAASGQRLVTAEGQDAVTIAQFTVVR